MKNHTAAPTRLWNGHSTRYPPPSVLRSALHLVTPCELQSLREALTRHQVPLDFQRKLASLSSGELLHSYIQQHSHLFLALLLAVQDGSFPGGNPPELDQLLRVLAYVRKDDDAIPDYRPGGYVDDQQEVRTAAGALHELLTRFKLWRLRHEVPKQWHRSHRESAQQSTGLGGS